MNSDQQSWRRWLEAPAISRESLEPAPARRRGPARLSSPPSRQRPGAQNRNSGPRSRAGFFLTLAVGSIAVTAVILALFGNGGSDAKPKSQSGNRPYTVISTSPDAINPPPAGTSTNPPAPPFCAPGTAGSTIVTDGAGDRASGPGVIAAYEHAYFAARDPKAALDLTDRGAGVPAETQLAQAISATSAGVPWCVAITDLGGNVFETSVRSLPDPGQQPVLWLLHITVAEDGGVYRIVNIADQAS
ncbi:hypothetical protein AB0C65_35625 [Nocardia sp. NPDC048505]|uniref:hypothetical protein n=1 Tax=Nocardia sp. NPDC048505 TaxID=3155756 RepID=UPI0033C7E41B